MHHFLSPNPMPALPRSLVLGLLVLVWLAGLWWTGLQAPGSTQFNAIQISPLAAYEIDDGPDTVEVLQDVPSCRKPVSGQGDEPHPCTCLDMEVLTRRCELRLMAVQIAPVPGPQPELPQLELQPPLRPPRLA